MSSGTTSFTVSTGTAKPIPALAPDGLAICVFTPMRRPALSSSGPPELPGLIAASVWMTFWILRLRQRLDRASERAHDAGRERLVEAERVPDREHLLPHLQPLARADENRRQLLRRSRDPEDGEILVRLDADDGGLPVRLVRERDDGGVGPGDDVKIRDDVSLPVPQKARARALRHLGHLEEVDRALGERRDVDDRRARALEERDRGLLVLGEIAARDDDPRLGLATRNLRGRRTDAVPSLGSPAQEKERSPSREEDDEERPEEAPPPHGRGRGIPDLGRDARQVDRASRSGRDADGLDDDLGLRDVLGSRRHGLDLVHDVHAGRRPCRTRSSRCPAARSRGSPESRCPSR